MKSVRRVSIDLRTSRLRRILEFPAPWIALPVPWMIILSMILAPTRTGSLGSSTTRLRPRISATHPRSDTHMASLIAPMLLMSSMTWFQYSRKARSRASRILSILVPGIGQTRSLTKRRRMWSGTRSWTSCTGEDHLPVDSPARGAGDDSIDNNSSVTPTLSIQQRS